jgi:hypothetical protein
VDAQEIYSRFGYKGQLVLVYLLRKPTVETVDRFMADTGLTPCEILQILHEMEKAGLVVTERA